MIVYYLWTKNLCKSKQINPKRIELAEYVS